jgi:DNA-binding NarL/FixJ family response regulator
MSQVAELRFAASGLLEQCLVPESNIIFLTQETSVDVLQEALSLGARGYVTKTKAQADLFAAVEAVLSGKTFVSDLSATPNLNFPPETQFRH